MNLLFMSLKIVYLFEKNNLIFESVYSFEKNRKDLLEIIEKQDVTQAKFNMGYRISELHSPKSLCFCSI